MSSSNCEWSKNQCVGLNGKKSLANWWDAFDNCGDAASVAIIHKYCGDFKKTNDENYLITLSENEGKYGRENLFCSYLYRTTKHNQKLKIEISKNNLQSENTKMELMIFYTDTNIVDRLTIGSSDKNFLYENVALIELFFYIKEPMNSTPFEILFTETEKGGLQIWVYVVIVLISILFPFTVIFLCFYIHFLLKKRRQSESPNVSTQESNRGISNHTQKRSRLIIDNLFKSQLKQITFDKTIHLKYGSKCTICLEDYKEKDLVSITLCHHVFHYKCLSNWLYKNSTAIRCPNCNQPLESKSTITVNHFDEVTVINVRSSENVVPTIQMTTTSNE